MAAAVGKVPKVVTQRTQKQGFSLGLVIAKHHNKTIKVAIDRRLKNRKYNSYYTRRSLFQVHDELNEATLGDLVIIRQSRKHSKHKYYTLHDIAVKYAPAEFLAKNPDYAEAIAEINKKAASHAIANPLSFAE